MGFNLPPAQLQLHMQYQVQPMVPERVFHAAAGGEWGAPRFWPFEILQKVLKAEIAKKEMGIPTKDVQWRKILEGNGMKQAVWQAYGIDYDEEYLKWIKPKLACAAKLFRKTPAFRPANFKQTMSKSADGKTFKIASKEPKVSNLELFRKNEYVWGKIEALRTKKPEELDAGENELLELIESKEFQMQETVLTKGVFEKLRNIFKDEQQDTTGVWSADRVKGRRYSHPKNLEDLIQPWWRAVSDVVRLQAKTASDVQKVVVKFIDILPKNIKTQENFRLAVAQAEKWKAEDALRENESPSRSTLWVFF